MMVNSKLHVTPNPPATLLTGRAPCILWIWGGWAPEPVWKMLREISYPCWELNNDCMAIQSAACHYNDGAILDLNRIHHNIMDPKKGTNYRGNWLGKVAKFHGFHGNYYCLFSHKNHTYVTMWIGMQAILSA